MGSDAAPQLAAEKMISYAQNHEDVLLNRVFKNVMDGFYIDIGAYHPTIGSVTKSFYDRGWSGINVEPGEVFDELKHARPRDINIKAAVVDHEGKVDFLQDLADPGTSKVATTEASETLKGGKGLRVQAVTLDNLVARHAAGRTINFLKIDAEGSEAAIIHSTNWQAIRPQILVIEATAPWSNRLVNQEWESTLLANDFVRVYFDGINVFYVRSEDKSFRSLFKLPVNVLDNYTLFNTELEWMRAENLNIQRTRDQLLAEQDDLRAEIAKVHERMEYLADSLDYSRDEVGRLGSQVLNLTCLLQLEQKNLAISTARAAHYDNVVKNLRDPGGPRALRLVLPLARLIRNIQQAFFAKSENPSAGSQSIVPIEANCAPVHAAPEALPQSILKRAALGIYKVTFRPFVRPLMWRARSFFTQPVNELRNEIQSNNNAILSNNNAILSNNEELNKSLEKLAITIASQPRK